MDLTEPKDVLYETRGPVALVTLNRPRYRNAQSWRLLDELDAALERAQSDTAIRVIFVSNVLPNASHSSGS